MSSVAKDNIAEDTIWKAEKIYVLSIDCAIATGYDG